MHRSLTSHPHLVSSTKGIYITLSSGTRILDGCAGAAVSIIGHGHPDVAAAVLDQMSKVSYIHTGAYTTDSAEDLANFLLEGNPFGLSKAYFIGSGSEAMDAALKLARQYWVERGQKERVRIVARRQAYHGNTIGAMAVGSFVARKAPYKDCFQLPYVSWVSPAYAYRGQRDDETEEEYSARLVEELDAEFQRLDPSTIIAFVAETVGGATAGCITPPKGYFAGVRRLCTKYDILLILDEVMCGSGRCGTYFAFEADGDVRPDMVTVGKGVGGGYAPIAGVLVHERIVDTLRKGSISGFNHGHTYQAHPVTCAAALAVQKVVRRDNVVERCRETGKYLEELLRRELGGEKYVGEIRGRGLFWGIEFVEDRKTKKPFAKEMRFGVRMTETAMELGLAVYPGAGTADGVVGDHIIVSPPLIITKEECDTLVKLLKQAYLQMEASVQS